MILSVLSWPAAARFIFSCAAVTFCRIIGKALRSASGAKVRFGRALPGPKWPFDARSASAYSGHACGGESLLYRLFGDSKEFAELSKSRTCGAQSAEFVNVHHGPPS